MTAVTFPLVIYYDGSCPLCANEMMALKARDLSGRLALVDCSDQGFKDVSIYQAGLSREALMQVIHARDAAGRWLKGIEVLGVAYQAVGLKLIGAVWMHPRLKTAWTRLYPWIARNRQLLSRLGLPALVRTAIGTASRPTTSNACEPTRCSTRGPLSGR